MAYSLAPEKFLEFKTEAYDNAKKKFVEENPNEELAADKGILGMLIAEKIHSSK